MHGRNILEFLSYDASVKWSKSNTRNYNTKPKAQRKTIPLNSITHKKAFTCDSRTREGWDRS